MTDILVALFTKLRCLLLVNACCTEEFMKFIVHII